MFNAAHLHIAINHLPVVGFLAALIFALISLFNFTRTMHLVAIGTALVSAIAGIAANLTGEPAEEAIEELAYSGAYLSAHERWGEWTYYAAIGVGLIALICFIGTLRRPQGSVAIACLMVVVTLAANVLATVTATLGGGIMHREIHSDEFSRQIHDLAMIPEERDMLAEEAADDHLGLEEPGIPDDAEPGDSDSHDSAGLPDTNDPNIDYD